MEVIIICLEKRCKRMEIVEDQEEGGFVVSYPDLPGCITCGKTVESAVANALNAKKAGIEAALENGILPEYTEQINNLFS